MVQTNYKIPLAGGTSLSGDDFKFSVPGVLQNALANAGTGGTNPVVIDGGFIVSEEREELPPKAPTQPITNSVGLIYKADLASTKFNDRVLRIDQLGTIQANSLTVKDDISYSLYTYGATSKGSGTAPTDELYVYTGDATGVGPNVTNYTFIPLRELKLRLTGNAEARKNVYIKDWLTFCLARSSIVTIPNSTPYIPPGMNQTALDQLKATFNGSHLETRNNIGEYKVGREFLKNLLEPTPNVDDVRNIPLMIFRKWCRVAEAASLVSRPLWSVKARFWTMPQSWSDGQAEVMTFIYVMPPNFFQELRNLTPSVQPSDSIKILTKFYKADALKQLWQGIMARVHNRAKDVLRAGVDAGGTDQQKLVLAVPSFRYPTDTEMAGQNSLRQIGAHPQGFFSVFVSAVDYTRLTTRYFGSGTRTAVELPTNLQAFQKFSPIGAGGDRIVPLALNASTTTSTITKVRVETAASTPRIETQNKVMGNVSATEVAVKAWNVDAKRVAEWLHRSAYSFGGLEDTSRQLPDNAQQPQNLVFGTYEANTRMIQLEEHIKRMAVRGNSVKLVTELLPDETWANTATSTLPWFSRRLRYAWSFTITGQQILRHYKLDLFSRSYPSRFEVELDAALDKLLFEDMDEVASVLYSLYLLTQASS